VKAAQGCKIIAKDLEKSLAGLPMFKAHQQDEIEVYKVGWCKCSVSSNACVIWIIVSNNTTLCCKLNIQQSN